MLTLFSPVKHDDILRETGVVTIVTCSAVTGTMFEGLDTHCVMSEIFQSQGETSPIVQQLKLMIKLEITTRKQNYNKITVKTVHYLKIRK